MRIREGKSDPIAPSLHVHQPQVKSNMRDCMKDRNTGYCTLRWKCTSTMVVLSQGW
jgi:hypothetical protein